MDELRIPLPLRYFPSAVGAKFYKPGRWALRNLKHAGIEWVFELAEWLTPSALAGLTLTLRLLPKDDKAYPNVLHWTVIVMVLQIAVTYLSKAQKSLEREEKQDAHEAARKAIRIMKQDSSGNLHHLLKATLKSSNPTLVQQELLRHAADLVRRHLGRPTDDTTIAASWVVPVSGDGQNWEFETRAHDRNRDHRAPGNRRPLADGRPGAPTAFITGEAAVIEDAWCEEMAQFFPVKPTYRSILSVPARALNVLQFGPAPKTCYTACDGNSVTVGVLNIDAVEPMLLKREHAYLVQDIAYLIALCETMDAGGES